MFCAVLVEVFCPWSPDRKSRGSLSGGVKGFIRLDGAEKAGSRAPRRFCRLLSCPRLEVARAVAGDQAKEEGEDDGTDDGDEDGIEQTALAGEANSAHDVAADDGAKDADDDVTEGAEAGALHELACDEAGDKTNDDPPDDKHAVDSP